MYRRAGWGRPHVGDSVRRGCHDRADSRLRDIAGSANQFGFVVLFAAAGTYDVSVQFKSSSGTVTAKERKLWVWTMGF